MDDEINENTVCNQFIELYKPTKADFERVFTEDELKKLCLKHKCRVDMWRWNVVDEYRILFTESGRYQRWSEHHRLRMLTKAVNRMKPSVLYDEHEILKTRKEEWGLQLKENILSLNYWQRLRSRSTEPHNSPRLVLTDSEYIDEAVQYAVNTETMNDEELLTQTQSQKIPTEEVPLNREFEQELQSQIEVNTESMNVSQILTQTQAQEPPVENISTDRVLTQAPSSESDITEYILCETQDEYLIDNSEDSIQSEEVAAEIDNMYGINTISMSIDSQMHNQSQGLAMLQSQDVIPARCDNLENSIHVASTQTQAQEPPVENISTDRVLTQAPSTESDIAEYFLFEIQDEYLIDDNSEDSIQSEEVAAEIDNMYGINTISMSIDSQMHTQSQGLALLQSQDVIPARYDNFENSIHLASTQLLNQ